MPNLISSKGDSPALKVYASTSLFLEMKSASEPPRECPVTDEMSYFFETAS